MREGQHYGSEQCENAGVQIFSYTRETSNECSRFGMCHRVRSWLNSVDEDSLPYGIDSVESSILRGRSKYHSDPRMKFVHGNIEGKLGFAGDSFDAALSDNVLECITDKQSLLAEVH